MDAPTPTTAPVTSPAPVAPADGGSPPPVPPGLPLSQGLTDAGLKSHQGLAKFKDVDSLAKSYIELDKLRNERTGVKPLTAESTPEDVAAYRQAMGIPDSWEKYEVEAPDYPEAVAPSPERLAAFRQLAHEIHLTPQQLERVLHFHAEDLAQAYQAQQDAQQAENDHTMAALKAKYGVNAVPYVQMAREYVNRRFGPDAAEALAAVGSNATFLEILIENARYTGHDKLVMADSRSGFLSKETALQRQQELWGQRFKTAPGSPERQAIDDEINRLGPIAHGT